MKKTILILTIITLLLGGTIFVIYKNNQNSKEEVIDIFKEDKKEEKSKKSGSIYDLLENNKNIIWKSTGTSDNINKSTIPVIGNNNLKPEILGSSKVDDLAFPDMNKKEGEILWKETM